jgi:hypothetical protein
MLHSFRKRTGIPTLPSGPSVLGIARFYSKPRIYRDFQGFQQSRAIRYWEEMKMSKNWECS